MAYKLTRAMRQYASIIEEEGGTITEHVRHTTHGLLVRYKFDGHPEEFTQLLASSVSSSNLRVLQNFRAQIRRNHPDRNKRTPCPSPPTPSQ